MRLMRSAITLGVARKLYGEARKPENQEKLRSLVARAKELRATRPKGPGRASG